MPRATAAPPCLREGGAVCVDGDATIDEGSFEDNVARFVGGALSVMDIAWYVYATRLHLGGYPFARLHPRVDRWREALHTDERFAREVAPPPPLAESIARNQLDWKRVGTTMADVVGF